VKPLLAPRPVRALGIDASSVERDAEAFNGPQAERERNGLAFSRASAVTQLMLDFIDRWLMELGLTTS
jgi:hypothetical protein